MPGQAFLDDADSSFNRDWLWFMIEALYYITPEFYVVGRYSEAGTYDNSEGYRFDGRIFAGADRALGFDMKRFQRFSLGFGLKLNPNVLIKIEGGWDRFTLIDVSPLDPENGNRWFAGGEVVLSF